MIDEILGITLGGVVVGATVVLGSWISDRWGLTPTASHLLAIVIVFGGMLLLGLVWAAVALWLDGG